MNSVFGADNPFENGWASEDAPAPSAPFGAPQSPTPVPQSASPILSKSPQQYSTIYTKLASTVTTMTDLETYVFSPLVTENYLTSYQTSRIIDTLYDHDLVPPNTETNFYYALGLIALEIDVAGSGDYVTLQFKLHAGLPKLPDAAAALLVADQSEEVPVLKDHVASDPLSAQLANTNLYNDNGGASWPDQNTDNLLADHSAISIDADSTLPESTHVNDVPYIKQYLTEIRDSFKPLVGVANQIRIKEVPEKEGLVFKHINYAITHQLNLGLHGPAGTKKVVRRYSDFVWLLEYLLKKYPFRVIPGLPPKKFTGASPDSQFLQRRRRGLHRFLNQLIKHPVLKQEPIVVTFLSVPTDLTSWRKQARIDYALEFKGEKISTNFINSIWPSVGEEFLQNWKNAEQNVPKMIDLWTKIVVLVERHEKRQQQIAFDNGKFVEMLSKFTALDNSLYPHKDEEKIMSSLNADDTSAINDSLSSISAFFGRTSTLLVDESYNINTEILEKFKNFLDYLYSLQELFERAKKLSINTIPQLQQRIKDNEQKHEKLSTDDVDIKGSELVKLRQTIVNDKQEMFQQLNKDWLIKRCCMDEYVMFQETQFLVSEAWTEWCRGRYKFQQKLTGQFESLSNEVTSDMPLER